MISKGEKSHKNCSFLQRLKPKVYKVKIELGGGSILPMKCRVALDLEENKSFYTFLIQVFRKLRIIKIYQLKLIQGSNRVRSNRPRVY